MKALPFHPCVLDWVLWEGRIPGGCMHLERKKRGEISNEGVNKDKPSNK
jgi:hypothetical protein